MSLHTINIVVAIATAPPPNHSGSDPATMAQNLSNAQAEQPIKRNRVGVSLSRLPKKKPKTVFQKFWTINRVAPQS